MTSRPRLALPFTTLAAPGVVRLVAGEDHRYALEGPDLDRWLPPLLARLDGATPVDEALAAVEPARREAARALLARLVGERVLVEGTAAQAHRPAAHRLAPEGTGPLVERLAGAGEGAPLPVLCQDRLDLEAARAFGARCRAAGLPHLWLSTGPLTRAFVSPVVLPDAGPCLQCLLDRLRRLSPAPEVWAALDAHARAGGAVAPVDFPAEGLAALAAVAAWKVRALAEPAPPPAVFRLHALERDAFELTTHRVFRDPECPVCST